MQAVNRLNQALGIGLHHHIVERVCLTTKAKQNARGPADRQWTRSCVEWAAYKVGSTEETKNEPAKLAAKLLGNEALEHTYSVRTIDTYSMLADFGKGAIAWCMHELCAEAMTSYGQTQVTGKAFGGMLSAQSMITKALTPRACNEAKHTPITTARHLAWTTARPS